MQRRFLWMFATVGLLSLFASCGDDESQSADTTVAEDRGADVLTEDESAEVIGPQPPITVVSEIEPVTGGGLRYGIEAETDSWNPTRARWALSGHLIAGTFYDPLAAFDSAGIAQPYLAESFVPNDEFTLWTINLRQGISFHDGSPLTGEVVADLINTHVGSGLTGPAVRPINSATATGELSVEVEMNTPWVVFPTVLTGQGGMVPHPSVFLPDADGNLAEDAEPIGTGPFVFDEWVRDDHLTVERNDSYWQEGLPYLTTIEFRPIVDFTSRDNALRRGEVDIMHTSNEPSIVEFRTEARDGEYQIVEDQGETEELFLMLNTAVEPLDDVRVRRALAHATDRRTVADVFAEGFYELSTGPYAPDSPWYAEVDYPEFDVAAATALIDEYEAETGTEVSIELVAAGRSNLEVLTVIQSQWQQAGIDVQVATTEQTELILNALSGDFQAYMWRQLSGPDPDMEWHWWHGANAAPIGQIALNFSRNNDQILNAALDDGRSSPELADRQAAYATVQEQFATEVPNIWLYHAIVAVVAQNRVRGITNAPLPDGAESLELGGGFTGWHRLTQTWIDPDV